MDNKFNYLLIAGIFIIGYLLYMAVAMGLSELLPWFYILIGPIIFIMTFAYLLWKLFKFVKNLFYKK